ncbi:uncharacterized protein [Procambarus clarkii]|uniref:uncharacterized protein n=1 Tax=Procambarus clarkii TaxID=6728 RepID=UPI003743ECD5
MDKASCRQHERRRKVAEKKDTKGKPKRSNRNEGNVMRKEVQRYKDKEKSLQHEEGSTVSNRRMTIHQGIYAHGCSSGAVHREIGLSKETKARAEANLSHILALANNATLEKHVSKPSVSTRSPRRSFLTKKASSHTPKHTIPSEKRKEEEHGTLRLSSSESDDIDNIIISQSKRHEIDKECYKSADSTNVTSPTVLPQEQKTKVTYHLRSKKCKIDVQNKKPLDKPETKERESAPEIERSLFKLLTTAVKISLEKKSKCLSGSRDLYLEALHKAHRKYEECNSPENRISPASSDALPLVHIMKTSGSVNKALRQSGDGNEKRGQVLDLMKTPSTSEYLKRNKEIELVSHHEGEVTEQESALNITVCPGTTIISPRALLRRYEEKLQKRSPKQLCGRIDLADISNQNESLHCLKCTSNNSVSDIKSKSEDVVLESNKLNLLAARGKDTSENKMLSLSKVKKSGYTKRSKIETPRSKSVCDSECPKTVVVNALHYLKRCEQQSKDQEKKDTSTNINKIGTLHCGFTKDGIPQNTNNTGLQIVTLPHLDTIFDHTRASKADCVHNKNHSLKLQDYGESLFPQCDGRNVKENGNKATYPIRRTGPVILDEQPNSPVITWKSAGRKMDERVAEVPFSSLSNLTYGLSRSPSLLSCVATSSNAPIFSLDYQSFLPACHSVPQDQSCNKKIQLDIRPEQVFAPAVDAYNQPSDKLKPHSHLDTKCCNFHTGNALLKKPMNSHSIQNIQPNISSKDRIFPASSLDTREPSWHSAFQDPLCPSSPTSFRNHSTSGSLQRSIACSDTCCSASVHKSGHVTNQNSQGFLISLDERECQPTSKYYNNLLKDLPIDSDIERTRGCREQSAMWPRVSNQHHASSVYSSAIDPHGERCRCERYSSTNPQDVFRDSQHIHPSHQDANICVGVQDWVDSSSSLASQMSHSHHTGTCDLPQVAANPLPASVPHLDSGLSPEDWIYKHTHY